MRERQISGVSPATFRRSPFNPKLLDSLPLQTDLSSPQRRKDAETTNQEPWFFRSHSGENPAKLKQTEAPTNGFPSNRSLVTEKKIEAPKLSQSNRWTVQRSAGQKMAPIGDAVEEARNIALGFVSSLLSRSNNQKPSKLNLNAPSGGGTEEEMQSFPGKAHSVPLLLSSPISDFPSLNSNTVNLTIQTSKAGFIGSIRTDGKIGTELERNSTDRKIRTELERNSMSLSPRTIDGSKAKSSEDFNLKNISAPGRNNQMQNPNPAFGRKCKISTTPDILRFNVMNESHLRSLRDGNSDSMNLDMVLESPTSQKPEISKSRPPSLSRTKFQREELLTLRSQSSTPKDLLTACARIHLQMRGSVSGKRSGNGVSQSPDFAPYVNKRTNQVCYFKRSPIISDTPDHHSHPVDERAFKSKIYCTNGATFKCTLVVKRDTLRRPPCIDADTQPDSKLDPNPPGLISEVQPNCSSTVPKPILRKKVRVQAYPPENYLASKKVPFIPIYSSPDLSLRILKKRSRDCFRPQQIGHSKRCCYHLHSACHKDPNKPSRNPIGSHHIVQRTRKCCFGSIGKPLATKLAKLETPLANRFSKFDCLHHFSQLEFSEIVQEQSPSNP